MRVPDVITPPSTKEIFSSVGHLERCAAQPVSPLSTSPGNESCQSVRKGDAQSSNGAKYGSCATKTNNPIEYNPNRLNSIS
ncbi:hypothetical protein AVEN_73628-1 [Araneus ventricosus]|uniref:Uncharacterized protein n=1 Tax=Araneus ventricosus TaxID=182803 RepID=A0A4Y2LK66_ARAVE|nr:hypothetical protein AVEN_73628-1 [Araneus ventricosus]